jgi:hypothetical protein
MRPQIIRPDDEAKQGRYGPTAVRLAVAGLEPAWNTTGWAPARTDAGRLTAARFR